MVNKTLEYSTQYDKLERGDVFVFRDGTTSYLVTSKATRPGGGTGMGEYPPRTTVTLSSGDILSWDPWHDQTMYREFKVVGFVPVVEGNFTYPIHLDSEYIAKQEKIKEERTERELAREKALSKLTDAEKSSLGLRD